MSNVDYEKFDSPPHQCLPKIIVWTPAKLSRQIKMLKRKIEKEKALQAGMVSLKHEIFSLAQEFEALVKLRTTFSM